MHPALFSAVTSLAAEAWPVARPELLGESESAAVKVGGRVIHTRELKEHLSKDTEHK